MFHFKKLKIDQEILEFIKNTYVFIDRVLYKKVIR